ncbi:MAG TPA: M24 family metallopeptidase [Roseiflexaceae bacterium]|nr:M24 family metallopeptidase [Roseiflexaceae bacterium]
MSTEFTTKRQRIAALMDTHGLDGLLLGRSAGWSWGTCGREANVATNSETAVAALLYTRTRDYLLADRIELPRLLAEELGDLPFEPVEFPWHEPARRAELAVELAGGALGSDIALPGVRQLGGEIAELRFELTPEEQARFRALGRDTGAAVEAAAAAVEPGMSEYAIAGLLARASFDRDAFPVVTLIAVDDRVRRFRHPPATAQRLERYAMLVLCARRHGLVVSATRLVHFGPLPADLHERALACARVDAAVIGASRPGTTLGDAFAALQDAYAAEGFADEWRDHHQGGLAGYENREVVATPGSPVAIRSGQAFAWNPSIAGVKSEDTVLVGDGGAEVLSATGTWPLYEIQHGGATIGRPAILER